MCWFITLGVDRKGAAAIEEIGRARDGFGVRSSLNPHLAGLFPAGDALFEITDGHCSCDLVGLEETEDQERLRRQYRKKGWSDAKITRALADRHRARESSRLHGRKNEGKRRLHDLIVRLARELGGVRAFAHFYKGSQDEEAVSAARSRHVVAGDFLLSHLAEDVLVEVAKEGG